MNTSMLARVEVGSLASDPLKVKVGVKQGCVLALTFFAIYLAALAFLSQLNLHLEDSTAFRSRLDVNLFNLRRLKVTTMT